MTFDLSFYRLHDMPDPKIGDIRDFFARKINFQVRDIDVEKLQSTLKQKNTAPLSIKEGIEIDYENPSTSVYFQMFYVPPHPLDEMPRFQGLEVTGLAAHVNLARPTYFALESIPLITGFADSFNLLTFDGQFSSKHKEPFKAEASVLIESWAQTNSWAVASLRKEGHEIKYLARERLDYNWNFLRKGPGMQQMLGDHVFVPTRIFLGQKRGTLGTFVSWTDYIPMVFPQVDWVLMGQSKRGKDFSVRGFAQLQDILQILPSNLKNLSEPVSHYLLSEEIAKDTRKRLDKIHLMEKKEITAVPPNMNVVDVPLA